MVRVDQGYSGVARPPGQSSSESAALLPGLRWSESTVEC